MYLGQQYENSSGFRKQNYYTLLRWAVGDFNFHR